MYVCSEQILGEEVTGYQLGEFRLGHWWQLAERYGYATLIENDGEISVYRLTKAGLQMVS
jgi:hypothetical protein